MDKDVLIRQLVEALEITLNSLKVEIYENNKHALRRDFEVEMDTLEAGKKIIEMEG